MRRALVVLFLFAGLSAAQSPQQAPPPFFPWWESPIGSRLDLTDDQRSQIREIQKEYRDRMIDQVAATQKADAAIQDLFDQQQVSERDATVAIDALVKARGDMTRSLTEMSLKLRRVLTAEQWQRLQAFQRRGDEFPRPSARPERRGGRALRPGPPDRNGPPPQEF